NVTDRCYAGGSDSATFTITPAPAVVVSNVQDASISACASEADINAAYAAWLGSFGVSGGCNPQGGFTGPTTMPNICGGSIQLTYNVTDRCYAGGSDSATFTVIAPDALVINCPDSIELTCSQNPQQVFDLWISGFSFSGGCSPTATDLSGYQLPLPGNTLSITYEVTDKCEVKSCTATFMVPDCVKPHCTYTQGYYGDYNGAACDINGNPTTDYQIMVNAINEAGGAYNFGSKPVGNYFTLKASDVYGNPTIAANNVFTMLPGGGTPRALVGFATFDTYSTWSDGDPLTASGSNSGKINNNLLSQTMTMFFNLSVDNTLGSFVLEPKFATSDVNCGSDEPIPNTYKEFKIHPNIIAYLNANYVGGATVANLFKLANRALGGENIGNLNHPLINDAVDNINRGFDGCRIQVPLVIIIIKPNVDILDTYRTNEPIFTVYPVPFKDVFTLKYDFDYPSDVKIQIFDTKGTLLQSENDTNPYLNKELSIRPKFNRGEGQMFFVKVITEKGVSIKKVISEK
ncbi:T9SS type A sorting domain-containing protein, partial [Flavobacterium amnicola]|uniref:T9SS type A sorting domain-containing protein n=3 Tax=Flavobacterium amnicola TaxID=2506422 RepID=UPI0013E94668